MLMTLSKNVLYEVCYFLQWLPTTMVNKLYSGILYDVDINRDIVGSLVSNLGKT